MKTTNKTIKKILSIALCLALVMSYVPMVSLNAFAADCDHDFNLDEDIKTAVTCNTCGEVVYESDSRWTEGSYEGFIDGTIATFKGYSEGSTDEIVAYYVVKTNNGESYKLSFDWAINQGYTAYGGFNLYLYHNGTEVITHAFTSEANPYRNIISEEYTYTADGKYQVFKFVFEKTNRGTWADGGRTAYLDNINHAREQVEEHTITVHPTSGGTVTADKNTATAGETVTLTVTSDEGYMFDSLDVFYMDEATSNWVYIELAEIENGYTFVMPNVDVEVDAKWECYHTGGTATCMGYKCEKCDHWYGEADKTKHTKETYTNGFRDCCGEYEPATQKADGYYEISNAGQLYWFAELVNSGTVDANAILINDIVINENVLDENGSLNEGEYRSWIPIGYYNSNSDYNMYQGTFDGNNKVVRGLYFNDSNRKNAGLFGYVYKGKIQNTGVEDSYIYADSNVGGVVGYISNEGSIIDNCYNKGYVGGLDSVGGVCGSGYLSTITACFNAGNVVGSNNYIGGIVGDIVDINLTKSDNTGSVDGDTWVGGIVGSSDGIINNCYNTGSVNGRNTVGGVVGSNADTVSNCYNVALVSGSYNVGNVCGGSSGSFENVYYLATEETDSIDGTTFKTAEQFASGEVAYLLQQGNTEQVWGQDNNQIDAKPMFTSNELYKVVTVAETGNYSVANVGDTNGDGTVDVIDYQALVNEILSDSNEQIETASYDDIVRYDLDGDGYLDVIDAYLLHLFINGFATVDVYAVGDYDLNGVAFEEADIKAIKHAIENPENLATYKKYASDINGDGKVDAEDTTLLTDIYGEVTGTECADNVNVYYRWGNKYSTCTATAMCTLCGKKVATETVNTTSETLSELTCTQDGKVNYTAIFENELFEAKVKTVTTEKLPHNLSDGICTVCGLIDGPIDATTMSADELNAAVAKALATGKTDIEVTLTPDAPAEMFTAIRRAIRDTEGVADGSINLTLGGVTSIPDHSEYANEESIIFGQVIQDENGEYLEMPDEVLELNSINLPDVVTIGEEAFYGCGNLTSVTAPKVQTIGQNAFGYTALTSVEFPELTTIPYAMFSGTRTLTSAKFPKVTTIENGGLMIGAGFTPENNPTPFPLELTAEGDITIGTNAFNVTSQNYSGKVDLVLHSNKSGEVNGLTWKGYTFKSIEFLCTDGTTNHTYGAAVNSGDGTHTYTCATCNLTKVESCHGEATCKELATCEACGVQFGELSDHILDPATGYCKFGCETWMATFKIEAEGNTTYYKDMVDFTNQELADGSVVTLLTDEKDFGWGVGGDYTLDLNGYDLTTAQYSVYAGKAGESENSEISIVNSADERSTVPYIRVNNCTLKIGGKVDVAKMILFNPCTIDLTNADFDSCTLTLNSSTLESCDLSQFILGNYAIYYTSGNVVTSELTTGTTYIIKAAQ